MPPPPIRRWTRIPVIATTAFSDSPALPQDPNASMIPFLFRNISSYPNKPALIDSNSGDSLTFFQFKTTVAKLSHALNTQLGITKNDVVLLFAPNSIHYPICAYSIIALGAIVTTANPQLTLQDLSAQIQDSKPKLIITVKELYRKVVNFKLPVVLLDSENSRNWWFLYKDLILKSGSVLELPKVLIRGDDTAALLYSSGTIGLKKGVMLSHKNFIAASQMVGCNKRLMGETHLCFLPMFHVFAFAIILYAQLQQGNTVVSMEGFSLSMEKFIFLEVFENIKKFSVTHLWVVPPVLLTIIKKQSLVNMYYIPSLKVIISGGAPLGRWLIEECVKMFPNLFLLQGYGLTETTAAISMGNAVKGLGYSGSTGRLLPGIEAQIVSVHHQSLPPNQYGEIWVRGATMMKGYLNSPLATNFLTKDTHGFVHTGDVGYFDDQGQLFVVGRINELIGTKEFQVAPTELEAHLFSHSEILDAAVIPFIPDKDTGDQVLVAFVVRVLRSVLTKEDVKRFIANQSDLQLRQVEFVESIPMSASGKILRSVLVQVLEVEAARSKM